MVRRIAVLIAARTVARRDRLWCDGRPAAASCSTGVSRGEDSMKSFRLANPATTVMAWLKHAKPTRHGEATKE